jgi:hypothetical protein
MDSDTILCGPIDHVIKAEHDFVVTGVEGSEDEPLIKRDYIDVQGAVAPLDPDLIHMGFGVNTGQMVVTSGMVPAAWVKPLVFQPS